MDARLTADDVNLSTRPSCWVILLCECAAHTSSSSLKSIHFCFKGIFESKVSALTASNQKTKKSGIKNGFGSTRERRQKEIFSQQTYNRHKSNEYLKENQYKFNLIHLFKVESKTDSLQKNHIFLGEDQLRRIQHPCREDPKEEFTGQHYFHEGFLDTGLSSNVRNFWFPVVPFQFWALTAAR